MYKCTKIKLEATIYFINSGKTIIVFFSFNMIKKSVIIKIHNRFLTNLLEEVFTDLITAKNENTKNPKSNAFHQYGADSQQLELQDCTINKNGVAKQCIIHNVLAKIPRASDLSNVNFINSYHLLTQLSCKYMY